MFLSLIVSFSGLLSLPLGAQTLDRKTLAWDQKKIDIGAVLEEKGPVQAEFYAVNNHQDSIFITDVITDCGCTSVDFSKDTLNRDGIASVKVQFDPDHRGGEFSKLIIVRTNQDIYGDTLYLEGINMPIPENIEMAYPHRIGDLGFKLSAVNMGHVFTNEPKIKYIEFHNFGRAEVSLQKVQDSLPSYLQVSMEPEILNPGQRGLLIFSYDGERKNDLGYFDERVQLKLKGDQELELRVMSVVYEYFSPVPKSMEDMVPKLGISETDIDLRDISANSKVSRSITFTNMGKELLLIRKIMTNCSCVVLDLEKDQLEPGERTDLKFTFDPKGRKGIDHKHISIFSNDPLNPVRTIVVKSSVK
ncbi:DUF1573 domain-containing protein [Aquiflexum lacus]|uniref:DUF1573 domain-containing protein n=1 Tax=Aquiflexum lacus TaxID=2483805 RepID=UPI001E516D97|nr:DUF1573 domain-containing protein [Aquiflexum lacus]